MSEWITYSGNGDCVEFQHQITGSVLVRDTKDRNGPFLQFTEAEWSVFTDGIKAELQRKNTAQGLHMAQLEQDALSGQGQRDQLVGMLRELLTVIFYRSQWSHFDCTPADCANKRAVMAATQLLIDLGGPR